MKAKKAQIPLIKVITILLFTTIILVTFSIYLFLVSDVPQKDAKFEQQYIVESIINSNCLLKENNIENCLDNINFENKSNAKITIINSQNENIERIYYIGSQEDFNRLQQYCGVTSSQVCSRNILIPLKSGREEYILNLNIITNK